MDSVFQVILIAILENIFPEKCLTFPENGLSERLEFRKYWMCKAFAGIFVFKGITGRLKMRKFILLSGVDRRGARVYSKQSDAEIHIFLKKTCAGPPRRRPAGSAGKMKNQFEDLTRRVIRSSIDWSGVGLRLDDYLAARFTYRSADEWRERIARREILVNDLPAEPERILALHDRLEYFPGDLPEPEAELSYRIAYEDDELLIVDKPGNLCVHPSGPFFRHTLWHMLCSVYGKIHLVNRLDRETSGLLIAAKNPKVAAKLGKPSWPVRKEYLALVFGSFPEPVEAYGFLVRDTASPVRKKRRFVAGERPPAGAVEIESARTLLCPEKPGRKFSMVRAVPETGRLHQIRATLFSLGFPLLGDKLYGPDDSIYLKIRSNAITDEDRARLVLPRQALHSARLELRHPLSGETVVAESPLPADLSACNLGDIGLY